MSFRQLLFPSHCGPNHPDIQALKELTNDLAATMKFRTNELTNKQMNVSIQCPSPVQAFIPPLNTAFSDRIFSSLRLQTNLVINLESCKFVDTFEIIS